MPEPLATQSLLLATMAGAGVVVMGAFYALFFTLSKMQQSRGFAGAALACYLALVGAVYLLVVSLKLDGFWLAVSSVMLIGYFIAPRVIWLLCVGTHGERQTYRRTL